LYANFWFAVGAVFLAISSLEAQSPSAIAIKDAHIVTVSGSDVPRGTVILRDGVIQDVGADAKIPSDAWVIDGAGLTVYPGFIDGLGTWGIPGANATPGGSARTAGAGSGTAPAAAQGRIMGPEDRPQTYASERAADIVNPADSRLEAARAAGFTTSATYPGRGIFTGQGAMINFSGERGREMVVAQPIGQQVAFRVGNGGIGRAFPSSLMGNISYVRQLYLDLGAIPKSERIVCCAYERSAAAGIRSQS